VRNIPSHLSSTHTTPSQVVSIVELLEGIISQAYDPDDFAASVHMYNLRLVSCTFMLLVKRVVLRSIQVRWGFETSLGGLHPHEVSDGRPIFSLHGVMEKLSGEERQLVKEVYFETYDLSFGGTGYPFNGDRCYLAHSMEAFCRGKDSGIHLVICPGERWDWVILAGITQPFKSMEDVQVTWLLRPLWLLCHPPGSVWANKQFHLIPIDADDNPDHPGSFDTLPPAAPQRIIFRNVNDDRDVIGAIESTQNHLRSIKAFWLLSNMYNLYLPYPSNHLPPARALSCIENIIWVIQADMKEDGGDSPTTPDGSPTSGFSSVGRMGEFISSRIHALIDILACFPLDNRFWRLDVRVSLGLPYGQELGCDWIVQKVESAMEEMLEVLVRGFHSLHLAVSVSLQPGREHYNIWDITDVCEDVGLVPGYRHRDVHLETERRFSVIGAKARRALTGPDRMLEWRLASSEKPRSFPHTQQQQEEVLSSRAGSWDLRPISSPSLWEVSRAFLERRVDNGVQRH
jgi:hypothetical protein